MRRLTAALLLAGLVVGCTARETVAPFSQLQTPAGGGSDPRAAFSEAYHVIATHPQILPIIADANSQYDVFGEHVNRNLTAFAATSPHLDRQGISDADVLQQMLALWRAPGVRVPEGAASARAALGELNRRSFSRSFAGDFAEATDASSAN